MAGKCKVTEFMHADDPEENIENHHMDSNFAQLIKFCKFYGKFSSGVSLFINKIMCFTVLVDSFNMHVVDHINLMDPYYLIGKFGSYWKELCSVVQGSFVW